MNPHREQMPEPDSLWEQQLPEIVQQVIDAGHEPDTDPLGSYTGWPTDNPEEPPVQDADDL